MRIVPAVLTLILLTLPGVTAGGPDSGAEPQEQRYFERSTPNPWTGPTMDSLYRRPMVMIESDWPSVGFTHGQTADFSAAHCDLKDSGRDPAGRPRYSWELTVDFTAQEMYEVGVGVPATLLVLGTPEGVSDYGADYRILATQDLSLDTTAPLVLTGSITPEGYWTQLCAALLYGVPARDAPAVLSYETSYRFPYEWSSLHYGEWSDMGVSHKQFSRVDHDSYSYSFDYRGRPDWKDEKWYRVGLFDAAGWMVGFLEAERSAPFTAEVNHTAGEITVHGEPRYMRVLGPGRPGG